MANEVDSLTIRVAGTGEGSIPADSFVDVVKDAVAILRDLDPGGTLVWRLKTASMSSPLSMTFVAEPRHGVEDWRRGVGATYLNVFRALDRNEQPPAHVPEKTLDRASHLMKVLNEGVQSVRFSAPGQEAVVPTQRVQAHVREFFLNKYPQSDDYATLEGMLETVTIHGGTKFYIYDIATGHKTECEIQPDRLSEVNALLERKARVAVSGIARYKGGSPVRIRVDKFEQMPQRSELPQFKDIQGINLTDGMDSVEYIRGLRDDD